VSHPDPNAPADRTPIEAGEVWENPATGELARVVETLFGLAREGHVNEKGMPGPLQLALIGREFSDVIVFRRPPPAIQRGLFGALAPIARARGYRGTYPCLSRTTLAPRPQGRANDPKEQGAPPGHCVCSKGIGPHREWTGDPGLATSCEFA
jgi:hypothetical protein